MIGMRVAASRSSISGRVGLLSSSRCFLRRLFQGQRPRRFVSASCSSRASSFHEKSVFQSLWNAAGICGDWGAWGSDVERGAGAAGSTGALG